MIGVLSLNLMKIGNSSVSRFCVLHGQNSSNLDSACLLIISVILKNKIKERSEKSNPSGHSAVQKYG